MRTNSHMQGCCFCFVHRPNPNVTGGAWPNPWSQWANSSYPTEGLHIMAAGLCDDGGVNGMNCQSNG